MVLCGYVGQFSAGRDDGTLLLWGALGTPPFVVLLAVLLPLLLRRPLATCRPRRPSRPATWSSSSCSSGGSTRSPTCCRRSRSSPTTAVTAQVLFTVADVGSKVLYGVLLAKICRVRSAAEGFAPALESSPHLSPR